MSGGWGGGGGGGAGANIPLSSSISANGILDGTTPVTIVPAPASGVKYYVMDINIYNKDTADVTITVTLVDSGGTNSILKRMIMDPSDTTGLGGMLLDATTKSVTVVMSGAPATSQPEWAVTYGEAGV